MIDRAAVAAREGVGLDLLEAGLAAGTIVIPCNTKRPRPIRAGAIGAGLRTKVNANIGTSPDIAELDQELAKLRVAVDAGADTVMDLSIAPDLDEVRRAIIAASPVPVGTVPIYEGPHYARRQGRSFLDLTADDFLACVRAHLDDGVDFITVHCGVTQATAARAVLAGRRTGVVSRGGTLTIEWMRHNRRENPLFERYDDLLALAREYGACLSLGDGLRPGSLHDATDRAQVGELLVIGELVARARAAGVAVMVEGPGHVPIDQIEANVRLEKAVCQGAPFYVLGPLVTDVGCGHDHITSAIGGALAAYWGADFLCYVTPSEHLGLPTPDDVRAGVIAARIAAHAGDLGKRAPGAAAWDEDVARARAALDWTRMIERSVDPARARQIHDQTPSRTAGVCTMCGEYCAILKTKEDRG